MTWEQFKREVEEGGVKDGDRLAWIRWDGDHTFSGVECHKRDVDSEDQFAGAWMIRNESY